MGVRQKGPPADQPLSQLSYRASRAGPAPPSSLRGWVPGRTDAPSVAVDPPQSTRSDPRPLDAVWSRCQHGRKQVLEKRIIGAAGLARAPFLLHSHPSSLLFPSFPAGCQSLSSLLSVFVFPCIISFPFLSAPTAPSRRCVVPVALRILSFARRSDVPRTSITSAAADSTCPILRLRSLSNAVDPRRWPCCKWAVGYNLALSQDSLIPSTPNQRTCGALEPSNASAPALWIQTAQHAQPSSLPSWHVRPTIEASFPLDARLTWDASSTSRHHA